MNILHRDFFCFRVVNIDFEAIHTFYRTISMEDNWFFFSTDSSSIHGGMDQRDSQFRWIHSLSKTIHRSSSTFVPTVRSSTMGTFLYQWRARTLSCQQQQNTTNKDIIFYNYSWKRNKVLFIEKVLTLQVIRFLYLLPIVCKKKSNDCNVGILFVPTKDH